LFDLTNDFKISEDLTIKSGAYFKKMVYGFFVLKHKSNALEIFKATVGIIAKQLYQLKRMLSKSVDLCSVTSRGRHDPVHSSFFGLLEQTNLCRFVQAKLPSNCSISFFIADPYSVKCIVSRNVVCFHSVFSEIVYKSKPIYIKKVTLQVLFMSFLVNPIFICLKIC